MTPLAKLAAGGFAMLALLAGLMPRDASGPAGRGGLTLYCAAAMRGPMEPIAAAYQRETGVAVSLRYGGSNTLLSQIEVTRRGDLFLAADESFVAAGRAKGLIAGSAPIATMRAVLAVPAGNPAGVRSLADLRGIRVACGNPDLTAIGAATRAALAEAGTWREFDRLVRGRGVYKPTVADVANDVGLGAVDAGVVWDAVAAQRPTIEAVDEHALRRAVARVAVGVLACSGQPERAERFANYLASAPFPRSVFAGYGYSEITDAGGALPAASMDEAAPK
ncbi:MAG: molybdate ABC transporter substrate-binding protein [Planctomycetota bacterium]